MSEIHLTFSPAVPIVQAQDTSWWDVVTLRPVFVPRSAPSGGFLRLTGQMAGVWHKLSQIV